ncbi:MAG TPA: LuxR C-terminal-related transcriptional regulator [Actinomycetota bacterium]
MSGRARSTRQWEGDQASGDWVPVSLVHIPTYGRSASPDGLHLPATWPLVGRGAELAFVAGAIADADCGGIVLAGGAGVGKTRLASEVIKGAAGQRCATEWVAATRAGASIPFGSFAHLLPDLVLSTVDRLGVLRRIIDALVTRANGRRLVVAIDDAHLLDDASATLVHQLAGTRDAFILATLRAGVPAPDPIVALWKDGMAERLELQALSEAQVHELVVQVLGGHVDGLTMAKLWEASGGNVLFLRELILAGTESGAVRKADGVWGWRAPMAVSSRLQEMIAARVGNLDPDEAALMEVIALGEPVSATLLETLFSPATLEAAERRGMAVVDRHGRRLSVRLAHPLYGEAVRSRCPALRARAIHRQLADGLEAAGARRSDDLLRLVTARLEAGQGGTPQLLVAGARRALGSFNPVLGERLARAAADAGGGIPAQLALAQALFGQGREEQGDVLLRLDRGLDTGAPDEGVRAVTAILRALGLLWIDGGSPVEAEVVLRRAEQGIEDPDLRDELTAVRALILLFSGRPVEAIAETLGILERVGANEAACVRTALATVPAFAVTGRVEHAVTIADGWMESAHRLTDKLALGPGHLLLGKTYALCLGGRLIEAETLAEREYHVALDQHAHVATAEWSLLRGRVALYRGRVVTACRWLMEAASLFRSPSGVNFLPVCLTGLAHANALAGDADAAEAALAEAKHVLRAGMALFEPELALAEAWMAALSGEQSRARGMMLEVADAAEESGQYAIAVLALHDIARLGDAECVAVRLSALAPSVEGPLARLCAEHVLALVRRDGERLDQLSESFRSLGADLVAAEAAAEAAAVHAANGKKASMLAASARGRRFLEACERARTPALTTLVAAPLTPREREIATLAAGGMTSLEIARRLVISARTVETHLQRAYAKLGVASRADLASVLKPGR